MLAAGVTERLLPVPIEVPPHEPLYHLQTALLPREPPVIPSETLLPLHTVEELMVAAVGAVEELLTLMVLLTQTVLLQVPSARRKYVVVADGVTTMLVPEPTKVPPHEPEYHLQFALCPNVPPFADRVTLTPRHIESDEAETEVAGTEVSLTTMVLTAHKVVLVMPSALTQYVVVVVGFTVRLLPDDIRVPPHELVYHLQVALKPRLPPEGVNVVDLPLQRVSDVDAAIPVGLLEESRTNMVFDMQMVLLHRPSARK